MIPFEEFAKLDLRVGQVRSVEPHPDADRLYCLTVDLGTETRRVVAGLKTTYAAETLLDKSVVVVANLARRAIRGVESEGMVLAADDGTVVSLLTSDRPVQPGAKVR